VSPSNHRVIRNTQMGPTAGGAHLYLGSSAAAERSQPMNTGFFGWRAPAQTVESVEGGRCQMKKLATPPRIKKARSGTVRIEADGSTA